MYRYRICLIASAILSVTSFGTETLANDLFNQFAKSCGEVCSDACGEGSLYRPLRRGTLFGNPGEGGPNLDEPLVTDRPDFTEASSTVGVGVAQIEMGYTYFFDDSATERTKSHSFPEPLLRLGVYDDWLELRVGWNYTDEDVNQTRTQGADDLYLGFKIGLTPQDEWVPEMALIPQMTVPTGANALTANRVLPGVNWIYGWELTDEISTAGSSQVNLALDGTGQSFAEFAQSWTVAFSLTDELGAYTEYYGIFPASGVGTQSENYFNGGFTYLLSNDVQWDIRAGVGLNDAADDYFVGSGLTIRFQ